MNYFLAVLRLELIYAVQAHTVGEVFPCKPIPIEMIPCLGAMNEAGTWFGSSGLVGGVIL